LDACGDVGGKFFFFGAPAKPVGPGPDGDPQADDGSNRQVEGIEGEGDDAAGRAGDASAKRSDAVGGGFINGDV
jgi:hypothetical protein